MWRRVRHLPQFLHILPRRTRRGGRLGRHLELFGSVHRSIVVPGNKPSPITLPTFFIASRWLGYVRLGLALSMIAACRGFSAIPCYSIPTATAIVAIPAMRRYKYIDVFSVGTVAATGNIGILTPQHPDHQGLLAEVNIAKLLTAGIIQSIFSASASVLWCLTNSFTTRANRRTSRAL